MSNRNVVATLSVAMTLGIGLTQTAAAMDAASFMSAVNKNADKTISKEELDAYAKKRFAALEADGDHTLDEKELRGRLTKAGMAAADSDKDKSVDEQEFVGYADKLFDEANTKGDKTLSLRELETPAGRQLIELLK